MSRPVRQPNPGARGSLCVALALAACAGNAVYAFGGPGGAIKYWSPAIVASALIGFTIVHGRGSYSGRILLTFAVTVFLVGWSFETLSVLTGFPFGNYHYTPPMAPFLGHVPVFVMPAYCVMGYVSWSMARIFLSRTNGETDALLRWGAPIVAAALMVVWDLSMDPLRATVEQRWIWLDGGGHLGVPFENYVGWALVTWVMFQSFAVLLPRRTPVDAPRPAGTLGYWLSVPLAYASFATEYLLNPFFAGDTAAAVLVNGAPTPVADIFGQVAIISAATMVPLALLAAVLTWRSWHAAADAPAAAVLAKQEQR